MHRPPANMKTSEIQKKLSHILSPKVLSEESLKTNLPPMIILNPRERIEAEQINLEDFVVREKEDEMTQEIATQVVPYPVNLSPLLPTPKFPVEMVWSPSDLYFVMDEEPVTLKVRIWNSSNRSMYFLYCGLWGDMARLGATWCCHPHTRIWLAPGLSSEVVVKANPREIAPIPCANVCMQMAAGHLRDNVTGYFCIPLRVKFAKYIPPSPPEGE